MRHVPTHAAPLPDDPPPGPSTMSTVVLLVVALVALVVTAGTTLVLTGVVGAPDPQPRVAPPAASGTPAATDGLATATAAPSPPLAPPTEPPTEPSTEPAATPAVTPTSRQAWARALVEDWHADRARAWRTVDEAALRALYVAGGRTAQADVSRLRRWDESGWRVAEQRTAVDGVRVEAVGRARLRLRVRERLTGAVAVDEQGAVRRLDGPAAPQDRTWRMRREGGRWLVVSTT